MVNGVKGMHSSSSVRTTKLQLTVEQPLTAGFWNPPKIDNLHPKTKKKPGEMVGGVQS